MPRTSRRAVLGLTGAAIAGSLGGCLDRLPGGVDPTSFSHPRGFATDGIDGERAFGPDSAMASLASVSLEGDWRINTPQFAIDGDMTGEFALAEARFVRSRRTFASLSRELRVVTSFFDSTELITKERLEPRSTGYRFSARSYDFDPVEELGLNDIQTILEGVQVRFEGAERAEQGLVGIYSADTQDFGDGSLVRLWGERFGDPRDASLEMRVTEAGLLTEAALQGVFQTADAEPVELAAGWRFGGFDQTTVDDPEWLTDVPNLERPIVEVEISEEPGEMVLVQVQSMQHTPEVAVVVEGVGTVGSTTEPGTIEIRAEAFTTDAGEVRRIFVVADNRLRGPIRVDQYWPQPV